MGGTLRQEIQVYRNLVIGLVLPVVLSGCLMNDSVNEAATSNAPSPTGSNSPPKITGNAPRMIRVGVTYTFHPNATDPESDALSFSIRNKPTWLNFDATIGYLSGMPALGNEGTYNDIEITVTDGKMETKLPPFSITVEPTTAPNMPPEIDGIPAASVIVGRTYSFTPSGSDPDGDMLTYSIQNMPIWATFNSSSGRLSGVPGAGEEGAYANIAITVSDSSMTSSLPEFSIDVFAENSAPQISGTPATIGTVGQNYSFIPTATDLDDDTLTFSIQNKPGWAQFNTATGVLSGTPQAGDANTYANISISVSDGELSDVLPAFTITVNQIGRGAATLNWIAPTQNEDGSQLTDLAGYKIYYGTSPGSYSNEITINNPGITSYVVSSLAPNTWYFVSTSFNASGMESDFSNQVARTVN
jgi:hypothetical protein